MSNPTSIRLRPSSLSFIALLGACSREVVDLGGATVGQNLKPGARCSASPIIDESVIVTNQTELDALLGCEEIRGDISVQFFADAELSPLESLRSVEGTLSLGADAPPPDSFDDDAAREAYRIEQERADAIAEAGWLPSLHGLESLERVGSLSLDGIAAADLRVFESLRNVSGHYSGPSAGQISVYRAKSLIDLSGLENVTGVALLDLSNNPALESLQGLQVGTSLIDLFLFADPRLSNLNALALLESVAGLLYLEDTGVENLDALTKLSSAERGLVLMNNAELENADALASLLSSESMLFQGNPKLVRLPAFPELLQLEYFKAIGNARLEAVSLDFPNLYNLNLVQEDTLELSAGVIEIGGNAALESIELPIGFGAAQVLSIYDNENLSRIDLGSLRRVDKLSISGNPRLSEVALGELQTVDSLSVLSNPLLSTAELAGVRTFESTFEQNADDPAP